MGAVEDAFALFGFTPEIGMSVANAVADPSKVNVEAVVGAYADNGQVVPAKLYGYLVQLNKEVYPNDPILQSYAESSIPWVVLGAGVIAYLVFGRRRRRK